MSGMCPRLGPTMRIAITGATGFLGTALSEALRTRGHEVVAARRGTAAELVWSIDGGFVPPDALSGFDAVVHLAGENVASGRWTRARKAEILGSRMLGTRRVVEALRAASPRPHTLVSASGISIYGDTGDREIDEHAPPGEGFLPEVAVAWEREAMAAEDLGVRVACMRIGLVLGRAGGALPKMLPMFRLGLGGPLGSGEQWMPWVHIDDAVAAFTHALEHDDARGPINLCAPGAVRNRELSRLLAAAVHRPSWLPAPRLALSLALGEMAQVLVTGQRAAPARLDELGFAFRFARLEAALSDLFG